MSKIGIAGKSGFSGKSWNSRNPTRGKSLEPRRGAHMAVLSDDFAAKCMARGLTREQVAIVVQVLAEDPKMKALVLMNSMDRSDRTVRA